MDGSPGNHPAPETPALRLILGHMVVTDQVNARRDDNSIGHLDDYGQVGHLFDESD
jgi:hypothetical protein